MIITMGKRLGADGRKEVTLKMGGKGACDSTLSRFQDLVQGWSALHLHQLLWNSMLSLTAKSETGGGRWRGEKCYGNQSTATKLYSQVSVMKYFPKLFPFPSQMSHIKPTASRI